MASHEPGKPNSLIRPVVSRMLGTKMEHQGSDGVAFGVAIFPSFHRPIGPFSPLHPWQTGRLRTGKVQRAIATATLCPQAPGPRPQSSVRAVGGSVPPLSLHLGCTQKGEGSPWMASGHLRPRP